MIGFLVQGRVRIKIGVRDRVRVMFNVGIYHRSKYCTFGCYILQGWLTHKPITAH